MRRSTLNIVLVFAAVLSAAGGGAFAQGGGNGQGGSGGGNAHSAATAGMTHWGDPNPSPLDVMPGSAPKKIDSAHGDMPSMSPRAPMNAAKSGQ